MLNRSINNYYVVMCVLGESNLNTGTDPVLDTQFVKFQDTQCKKFLKQ